MRKIFLLRHGDYEGSVSDPVLSDTGKQQSLSLANKIKLNLNGYTGDVTIWTSTANRAKGMAQIIKQELQLASLIEIENLWSDSRHEYHFRWLKEELNGFKGEVLIIISHLEYVRDFPEMLGFPGNKAGYAQGVLIEEGRCNNFNFN